MLSLLFFFPLFEVSLFLVVHLGMVKRIVLLLLGSQIMFVRPHSQRINIVQTHLAILKCVEVIKKILSVCQHCSGRRFKLVS